MHASPIPAADWLVAAEAPAPRGAPARPATGGRDAVEDAAGFAAVLAALAPAMPGGESLPSGGNTLPPSDSVARSGGLPAVPPPQPAATADPPAARVQAPPQPATAVGDVPSVAEAGRAFEQTVGAAADDRPADGAQGSLGRPSAEQPRAVPPHASADGAMPRAPEAAPDPAGQAGRREPPAAERIGTLLPAAPAARPVVGPPAARDAATVTAAPPEAAPSDAADVSGASPEPASGDGAAGERGARSGLDAGAPAAGGTPSGSVSATPALEVSAAPPPIVSGEGRPAAATAPDATAAGDGAAAGRAETPEALARGVRFMLDHRLGEARLTLNPPELGTVDVKIALADDQAHVQLVASSPAAREELEHSLPRLRELFAEGGLELANATVSGGRGGDDRRAADTPPEWAPIDAIAAGEPEAAVRPRARGRIDLYA